MVSSSRHQNCTKWAARSIGLQVVPPTVLKLHTTNGWFNLTYLWAVEIGAFEAALLGVTVELGEYFAAAPVVMAELAA